MAYSFGLLYLIVLVFVLSVALCEESVITNGSSRNPEQRLVQHLLSDNSQTFRPRPSANPVVVHFDLTLVQILDFDVKKQKLTTQAWQNMKWQDSALSWNPAEFDDIGTIRINTGMVWAADIILYNRYGDLKTPPNHLKTLITHSGHIVYIPPVILESSCQVDLSDFPFDTQSCSLVFGSWSYSVKELDIVTNTSESLILSQYIPNLEWELIKVEVSRTVEEFECCDEAYVLVTYTLVLRRNHGYHVRVLLLPVMLLSIMAIFIFCVPTHRPDRTGLGLGLFTGFMLLLLLVVDLSPPSAESNLSIYLSACVGIVTSAIIVSIVLIYVSTWKGSVPAGARKLLAFLHKVMFPLTPIPHALSRDRMTSPQQVSDWVMAVTVVDRVMFFTYAITLATCLSLYFPFPK